MGGVLGRVTQVPRSSAKNSQLQVDVSGLVVSVKMADVRWTAENASAPQGKPSETKKRGQHRSTIRMASVPAPQRTS